jgi:hypothetical protein
MKKRMSFSVGVLALALTFGLRVVGCASASSIGGTADRHGLISKAKVVSEGTEELASYGVILGLVDSGYEKYAAKVLEAETNGKKVTTVTRDYFGFYTKVTAYAQ